MKKYEMTAECVFVGAIQEVGSKGFQKREVVLCEDKNAKYPTYLAWELKRDRVNLVNDKMEGKVLTISGYPESRSWTGKDGATKFFTAMTAVSVTVDEEGRTEVEPPEDIDVAETEDLPF